MASKIHFKYSTGAPDFECKTACGIYLSEGKRHTTKVQEFVTCKNCTRAIESNFNPNLKQKITYVKSSNAFISL